MSKGNVGGQAVIEGVMMRGEKGLAISVRTSKNKIVTDVKNNIPLTKKYKFLNIPFIRGAFLLIESMIIGINALNYSASFFEEDAEPSRFEKWLNSKIGETAFNNIAISITMMISLAMSIGIFIGIPTAITSLFRSFELSPVVLNLIEAAIRVSILIVYMYFISKLEDIRRTFQYHGAEHKVIACYEDGEKLTIENVKKYGRYHARCGTNFIFLTMLVSILLFSLTGWGGFWERIILRVLLMPIVAGITYELIKWLGRTNSSLGKIISYPGLMLQRLTTKEPDDAQIEVAIESLLAAEGIEYKETISELIAYGADELKKVGIDSYLIDSQLLLAEVLNVDRLYLLTNRNEEVKKSNEKKFKNFINKRKDKMPIKYILKKAEFMGLEFYVEEGVLIPRGDTEILVEEVLSRISDLEVSICDLCCGSGAIGISLAEIKKNIKVDLVDLYEKPESVTKKNIRKYKLQDRAKFIKSDLLNSVIESGKKYDLLVSNPPYIKDDVVPTLMEDVKDYEPHTALAGGIDGLDFYKKIIDQSIEVLNENGILAFEIGYDQGIEVKELMIKKGYDNVQVIQDLAGLDRVVIGNLKS